ncbi:TRAG family protein [Paenibacillus luteus]|uniref:TRAG family protein n=1 Tax=Paenibacillus luteus TaxID=2545753 RepID=UPI001144547B|nr:TRAG family protein [Paenibacillus luteus]
MTLKTKLWLSLLFLTLGAVFNLFFTTALHNLLSGTTRTLAFPSLSLSLNSLLYTKAHLLLFLCFQGIVMVLAVLFFLANSQPYQSKLKRVAPGIETPVPVGQHQHGSARWMQENEMPHLFESQTVDLGHPFIRHLMDTGYDDLTFMNSKDKEDALHEVHSPEGDS